MYFNVFLNNSLLHDDYYDIIYDVKYDYLLFCQQTVDELAVSCITHELFSGDVTITILVNDAGDVINARLEKILILIHLRKSKMQRCL